MKAKKVPRDFHKLAILKGEVRGYTTAVPSKKLYSRKEKYQKRGG